MSERPGYDFRGRPLSPTTGQGCDCPDCRAGDDKWCCRTCHTLATETYLGEPTD